MKALILGYNLENYYAKVHESFRDGLKAMFDVRSFGEGYDNYDSTIKDIDGIIKRVFGDEAIDYLFIYFDYLYSFNNDNENCLQPTVTGIKDIKVKKIAFIEDFWSEINDRIDKYDECLKKYNIDYVLTLFRAPFHLWKNHSIYNKLIWRPVCFDPKIFNDWGFSKLYDVGNLNAGMFKDNRFYHERYAFHQILLNMTDINYYYANHPGDGMQSKDAELIGKKFSIVLNKCKIFVTSGNLQYGNFAPKYVEAMASGCLVMANEPMDSEIIGLIDGINYVRVDESNLEEKVRYYLHHENELREIAHNGYLLAMEKYTSYAVAVNVYRQLVDKEMKS